MTALNIALLESQRLTDSPNGGGQMTNNVIPDNQPDNLFSPISRINRSNGNVSLRKAFAMARSADTAQYLGAHAIIAKPPTNPGVTALMFSTGSWTDTRADAANAIESFLVQGPQTRLWPYGRQVIGQRSIICYQPTSEPLPNIGETYVIVNTTVTPNIVQFVRIESLASRQQSFTDTTGTFELNVITLGITSRLTADFPGAVAQRYSTPPPPSLICTTNVADAAVYHGVETLADDAAIDDETATLTSIFGRLLPSTQGEVPITNASPIGASAIVAAATDPVLLFFNTAVSAATLYAGTAFVPGSLQVIDGVPSVRAVDDGAGNLRQGNTTTGAIIGSIDYQHGTISPTLPQYSGIQFASFYAIPAAVVSQAAFSAQQAVTQSTRGYVYTQALLPLPAPGTATVSYRALGRWSDLRDDGSGTLVGADGAGAGSVRFDSGALSVTLGALPDIGSNVIFSWGQSAQFDVRVADVTIQAPAAKLTLAHPAQPSSITVDWTVGGVGKSATDNGAGVLTGDATGTVEYGGGVINLIPSSLPDPSTGYSVAYTSQPQDVEPYTPTKSGSDITLTAANAPITAKSVRITYALTSTVYNPYLTDGGLAILRSIHDDGAGGLVDSVFGPIVGSSVNYTTGVISFNPDLAVQGQYPVYTTDPTAFWNDALSPPAWDVHNVTRLVTWVHYNYTAAFINASTVNLAYTESGASPTSRNESFSAPAVIVDLTPQTNEPIVAGGVRFDFGGDTYVDRSGQIFRSINLSTNAGIAAGSIDYTTGIATITNWASGSSPALTVQALLCEFGISPVGYLSARVPGQSVRPASFFIQANRSSDGATVTATADSDGNWTTAAMTGHIDVTTGFFSVAFGASVLDSSLTIDDKALPWYDAANVDGTGHIWRPDEAIPGSIKYSCVVLTSLPLSANVLGLDPVRLPLDGRVQIFRPGDTLVFRNPLVYSVSGTPAANDVISLPRGDLESAILFDADAVQVDTDNYAVDLAAGTITMAAVIDLSSYTGPYTVTHAVADMVLCTDVQITGQISFSPALLNDYPADSSYVSGALIADNAGNLQAGYDTLFEQTTWNFNPDSLWEDEVQGSSPTPVYNDVTYPIETLDSDCITQRWALIFTSSTTGNIASEHLGVIGTFSTSTNIAPLNPATGNPYFVLDHNGFGTGWSVGNAIRFNTVGAGFPIWFVRSVQVGTVGTTDDSFTTIPRWDE